MTAEVKLNKVVALRGTAKLMPAGKQAIATSMYLKGRAFLEAAVVLSAKASSEATEYVYLYLVCQSIEVSLKGLLLHADYNKYKPLLKSDRKNKNSLGHDLLKTAEAAHQAFGLPPIRNGLKVELQKLTNLYEGHMLRYGHMHDLFIAPSSIERRLVIRRFAKVVHVADRRFRTAQPAA